MTQTLITALVSKSMFESQLETIESMRMFLAQKEDTDMDFMNELLNEFKAKVEADYKPPKGSAKALKEISGVKKPKHDKPKKLSAYTLFIQYKMKSAEFKAENPTAKGKDLMSRATAVWTSLPDSFKEQMKALNKEDPTLMGAELFDRVSHMEPDDDSSKDTQSSTTPSAPTKKPPSDDSLDTSPTKSSPRTPDA